MTSEPVFVRKPGAADEDEGWIMSYVYDPEQDLSDVVILDAQDFTGEPIATIRRRFACRTVFTEAGRPTRSPSSSSARDGDSVRGTHAWAGARRLAA
jgi:hypothetical protein